MDKKQILEKIKKCLALSKSANEHEAAAALTKARELMDAHGVSDAEILIADVSETRSKATRGRNLPAYEEMLANVVGKAFNCRVIFSSETNWNTYNPQKFCRFIGIHIQPELAQFAYDVLSGQLKKQRATYIKTKLKRCKTANKTLRADMFCEGWVSSVREAVNKFASYKPNPAIKAYIDTKFPRLKSEEYKSRTDGKYSERNLTDFFNGAMAGKDAKLHHGVGGDNLKELG